MSNIQQIARDEVAKHAAEPNAHGVAGAIMGQNHTHTGGADGAQIIHGNLLAMDADDHTQYALTASGSRMETAIDAPRDKDHLEYDEATGKWVARNGLIRATGIPSDQNGDYLTTLEYDASTRTWTVLPIAPATTFDVFVQGVRHTFSSIVQTHPATVGGHFLYVDLDGSVVVATTPWSLIHDAPISYVYFDGVLGLPFDERHHAGRDVWWHQNQHRNEGTKAGTGFALTGYTLNDGSTDAAVTFAISSGRVEDEDIAVDTQAVADGGPYTGMYRSGSGGWLFVRSLSRPFLDAANALQFNQFSGGTWSRAAVPEDRFVNYWFFTLTALPKEGINGWGASPSQIIFVPGQTTYATEAEAHSESVSSLLWGDMPFQEIAPLYQVTLRYNATVPLAYTNTARCAIIRVVRVVGSASIITQSAAIDHGSLVGLQDDDHTTLYPRWSGSTRADFYGAPLPADPQNPAPTDLVNGDLFFYNAANARWESGRQTAFALTSGTTRADFLCDSPTEGNVLRFDAVAGKWKAIANPFEEQSQKGAANGYAPLNASQKIEAFYLPSYVDDVVEYANLAAFPGTGETGKIYVALDTNKIYRWSGSAYIEISPSPGSTDSVTEGVSNLYFTAQRVRDTVLTGLSLASSAVISATDTVLSALGKLQSQITALAPRLLPSGGSDGQVLTKTSGTDYAVAWETPSVTAPTIYEPVYSNGQPVTVGDALLPVVAPYVSGELTWAYPFWERLDEPTYFNAPVGYTQDRGTVALGVDSAAEAVVLTPFFLSTGKYIFEAVLYAASGTAGQVAICIGANTTATDSFGFLVPSMTTFGGWDDAAINLGDAQSAAVTIAVDCDLGKAWIATDGTWRGSGDPTNTPAATWTGGTPVRIYAILDGNATYLHYVTLKKGFDGLSVSVPTGFGEWKKQVTT